MHNISEWNHRSHVAIFCVFVGVVGEWNGFRCAIEYWTTIERQCGEFNIGNIQFLRTILHIEKLIGLAGSLYVCQFACINKFWNRTLQKAWFDFIQWRSNLPYPPYIAASIDHHTSSTKHRTYLISVQNLNSQMHGSSLYWSKSNNIPLRLTIYFEIKDRSIALEYNILYILRHAGPCTYAHELIADLCAWQRARMCLSVCDVQKNVSSFSMHTQYTPRIHHIIVYISKIE